MAGAAFLRSVAAKTARAQPRLSSALEERLQHHRGLLPTSLNRLWLSGFSTSTTGSTRPRPNKFMGRQTHNKEVLTDSEVWDEVSDCAKAALIKCVPDATFLVVFIGCMCYGYITKPDHVKDSRDAVLTEKDGQDSRAAARK